jgi:hypothetical protein
MPFRPRPPRGRLRPLRTGESDLPKVTRNNPSRSNKSQGRGMTRSAFANPARPGVPLMSCALCASTTTLRQFPDDIVLCRGCRAAQGLQGQGSRLPEPEAPSCDLRGVSRFATTPIGTPDARLLKFGGRFDCRYPGCEWHSKYPRVACPEHWKLIPDALKTEFRKSKGTSARKAVHDRIVRYLETRARLRELAAR